jgi:hypothetical protein
MASTTGTVTNATSASYVEYSNVADKPALISSSAQIVGYGVFATTGSNQFNGSQAVTGSLTVTGQVVAQTLNVQQVTSSIVYSSGSNIFGNSLSNTQQFTGSVSVTGSLTVVTAGTELQVTSTGVNLGNALTDSHIISGSLRVNPNGLFVSGSGNVGIGTVSPLGNLEVRGANRLVSADGILQVNSSNSIGIDLGGSISFGGAWTGTSITEWAQIAGRKENGTNGDFAGYLAFATRPGTGGGVNTERMRITSGGNVLVGNATTSNSGLLSIAVGNSVGGAVKVHDTDGGGTIELQATAGLTYLVTTTNHSLLIGTNNTERMRITNDGNIEYLGTATGLAAAYFTNNNSEFKLHSTLGGNTTKDLILQSGGSPGAPQLILKAGGNVGIGTTSPVSLLDVQGPSGTAGSVLFTIQKAGGFGNTDFFQYYNSSSDYGINFGLSVSNSTNGRSSISLKSDTSGNGTIVFTTTATERMLITSGGYLKVSNNGSYVSSTANFHEMTAGANDADLLFMRHTAASPYGAEIQFSAASPNNTTNWFAYYYDSTNVKFIVYSNGSVVNRTGSYGTISDIKYKENIVDATPKLDDILKLQVRNFNLIGDNKKQIGFIAQEFEEVFPSMVDISIDKNTEEEYKSIKTTVLIPMLVKAIQELKSENDALKEILQRNNIS